jgi:hypothetical protein
LVTIFIYFHIKEHLTMNTISKKGLKIAVTVCLLAMGLVIGSSLMYGASIAVYARQPFVGGAIVIGTSENQKISCSTGSSKDTHGLQFSAHTRDGTLHGYWDIASPFAGAENKGGYIYDGSSTGKTFELKGKETQDGICHAKVPKDVIISGKCGKGVIINYKTVNGLTHTFTSNVKCLGITT